MFDILPLSGVLLPGQTQQIQFTFYGHSCLSATAIAVCQVDGGPSYHLTLKGEASGVSHQISRTEIPLGEVVSVLEMLWISWQIKCSLIYKCVSKWKLHKLLNTGITIYCTYVTLYTTYTTYFTIHMVYNSRPTYCIRNHLCVFPVSLLLYLHISSALSSFSCMTG